MSRCIRIAPLIRGGILGLAAWGAAASFAASAAGSDSQDRSRAVHLCDDSRSLPSPHCGGTTPTPAFDTEGNLWLAFTQHGHIYVANSRDLGETFAAPVAANPRAERIYADGENRPKIALGSKGEIYLSWVHRTEGIYTGDIRFTRSLDGGATFETPLTINDDELLTSHRFDSLAVTDNGDIYIAWMDKRDKVDAENRDEEYPGAALYFAVSRDGGNSFARNIKAADNSCECCRVTIDARTSPPVALWRHVFGGSIRDHAMLPLAPGIQSRSPIRVTFDDWAINGCPHHGPHMDSDSIGLYHVAWFNGAPEHTGLFYGRFDARSRKLLHQEAVDVRVGAARPHVLVQGDTVHLAWKILDGDVTTLLTRHAPTGGGQLSTVEGIATTAGDSDHPQLISSGDQPYLSWHTELEGHRLFKLATPKP